MTALPTGRPASLWSRNALLPVIATIAASFATGCLTPEFLLPDGTVRPSCDNGTVDEGETDIDCGGESCEACDNTANCKTDRDCQSKNCLGLTCSTPTCSDGRLNQDESSVDCGGTCGPSCAVGEACRGDEDCDSSACKNQVCVDASCNDNRQNNGETDVDCGGSLCGPCEVGLRCRITTDCLQPDPSTFEQSVDLGSATCSSGEGESRWSLACPVHFDDCDLRAINGCEVNIRVSPTHCGGCGQACNPDNSVSSHCELGRCQVDECAEGFEDCDADEPGCETRITNDPDNCGGCGEVCSRQNGQAYCEAGTCGIDCDAGFADCDAATNPGRNGCEVNILTHPRNCGGCGAEDAKFICEGDRENELFPVCRDGSCSTVDCKGKNGLAACDIDGECDDPLTTNTNCGDCGNGCEVLGGSGQCSAPEAAPSAYACEVVSCADGLADCDGVPTDCEVDVRTDPEHCGGCNDDGGNNCERLVTPNLHVKSVSCVAGGCAITSCESGYDDCDRQIANGCEANVQSPERCGGCLADDPKPGDGSSCAVLLPKAVAPECTEGVCRANCNEGLCPTSEGECSIVLGTASACRSCGESCPAGAPACDPTQGCVDVGTISLVRATHGHNNSGSGKLSLSFPLVTAPTPGRAVVALVSSVRPIAAGGVKIGSTNMVPLVEQAVAANQDQGFVGIYYLPNTSPAISSTGTKSLEISTGTTGSWGGVVASLVELTGVSETYPVSPEAPRLAKPVAPCGNIGQTLQASAPAQISGPNSLVLGVMTVRGTVPAQVTPVNLTPLSNLGSASGQGQGVMGTLFAPNNSGSVTVGWSVTRQSGDTCWDVGFAAVALNPVAAP